MKPQKLGLLFLILGLSLFLLAIWGLWRDIGWLAQPFYAYAWWGYIFALDGFCVLRRGSSLFTSRWKLLPLLLLGSVSFWFFFELLNVRFQNWYYVEVFGGNTSIEMLGAAFFTVVCFATVFTGIFETYEALTALDCFVEWQTSPRKFSPGFSYAIQALGVLMAGLAICFPYYLAPLIWGSLTFLVDPWNYRHGARSILRDIEEGNWGLFARVFIAGLICGFVWESLNFFAPQKWIYTVRGLENFKLFEMPLLGFLGFPALAFDSIAAFALFSYFLNGNQSWENPKDLPYSLSVRARPAVWVLLVVAGLQPFFWGFVAGLMIPVNMGSVAVQLRDLGFVSQELQQLDAQGIQRPRQLLRAVADPAKRTQIQALLSLDDERWNFCLRRAELFTLKGIGAYYGELLERVGVDEVKKLQTWNAKTLQETVARKASETGWWAPRQEMVQVWITAARDR